MDAYIIDVDGTLADLSHRVHHYGRDHDAFEAGIPEDAPIWATIYLARALHDCGFAIVITSGRAERTKPATLAWFKQYGIPCDAIYMRADGDHRADHVVKRQLLDGIRADGYSIIGVIDDRQSVVDMWREEGLTCLQNAPNPIASGYQTPDGTRPTLNLMVGPSGAGKSTWLGSTHAHAAGIHPSHVIASDQVRLDLFGTLHCMDRNDAVHDALNTVAKTRLKMGLPVTIDATNIRDRDRRACAELAQGVCPVHYIVIDRPLDQKLCTGGWRNEVRFEKTNQNLIERHHTVFQSNLKAILRGDDLPNVTVHDLRDPLAV